MSAGKIVYLGCVTRHDLPPDRVLAGAQGELKQVLVLGFDHDGEAHFASSAADGGDCLWLMEKCKQALLCS